MTINIHLYYLYNEKKWPKYVSKTLVKIFFQVIITIEKKNNNNNVVE